MNELQKKLERRRNLNGEGGNPSNSTTTVDSSPTVSPKISNDSIQPGILHRQRSTESNSVSSATELQLKLARRRGLNGEIPKDTQPVALEDEFRPSLVDGNVSELSATDLMSAVKTNEFQEQSQVHEYEHSLELSSINSDLKVDSVEHVDNGLLPEDNTCPKAVDVTPTPDVAIAPSSLTEDGYITEAVSSTETVTEPVEVESVESIHVETSGPVIDADELSQVTVDSADAGETLGLTADSTGEVAPQTYHVEHPVEEQMIDVQDAVHTEDEVKTEVSPSTEPESSTDTPTTTQTESQTSQPVVIADPSSLEAQQLAAVAAAAAVDAVFDEYMGRSLDAADGDYATSSESTLAETPLQNSVASSAFNSTRNSHDNLVLLGGPTSGDVANRSRQSSVDFGHHSMTAHLVSPQPHRLAAAGGLNSTNSNSNSSLSGSHGEHEKAASTSPTKQSTPPAAKHHPSVTSPKAAHNSSSSSSTSSSSAPAISAPVPAAHNPSTPIKLVQKHSTSSSDLTSPISHNVTTLTSIATPSNAASTVGGGGGGVSPKTPWFPGKYILQRATGGASASSTPLNMNSSMAQSHYNDFLKSSASQDSGSRSVSPTPVRSREVQTAKPHAAPTNSSFKSGNASQKTNATLSFSADTAPQKEHPTLNNSEIEALLSANSRLIAQVRKLKEENDRQLVVIQSYQRAYPEHEIEPQQSEEKQKPVEEKLTPPLNNVSVPTPVTTVSKSDPSSAPSSTDIIDGATASSRQQPMNRAKSLKRLNNLGYYSSYRSEEGDAEDDDEGEGLFSESGPPSRQMGAKKLSQSAALGFDDMFSAGDETSGRRGSGNRGGHSIKASSVGDDDDDVLGSQDNLAMLLNSFNDFGLDSSTSTTSSVSTQNTSAREASKSVKYNPLQLASNDLVRSFVNGPSSTQQSKDSDNAVSKAQRMKDKLNSHGLFGDDDNNDITAPQQNDSDQQGDISQNNAESSSGRETSSSSSKKERNLFKEDAASSSEKVKPLETENDMSYHEFISRFPKCVELVDFARRFLFSVLGPNGDCSPPPNKKKVDYIFYGTTSLDERCRDFFDDMQRKFSIHNEFKNENEERLLSARDCLEQYIMTRLAEHAFRSTETREEDDRLAKRMKMLAFLTPEALEIKAELFNETLLAIAADELRKINAFKTPGEKVSCVVKSAAVIFRSLNLSRAKRDSDHNSILNSDGTAAHSSSGENNSTPAGADDFLPLFIWVVMRSHIPKLFSNCEYIQAYLNPARLMGKSGYCLINLRSAIEFVNYIEAESLHIDAKEFDDKLAEAERELNGGFN